MILLLVFKRTLWGTSPRFVQALKKHLRTNIRKAARLVPSCSCLSQSHRGALWLEQTSLSSFYRSDENVLLITPEKFHRRLISELSRTSHSMARGQSTEANPNRVPFENTRWKSFELISYANCDQMIFHSRLNSTTTILRFKRTFVRESIPIWSAWVKRVNVDNRCPPRDEQDKKKNREKKTKQETRYKLQSTISILFSNASRIHLFGPHGGSKMTKTNDRFVSPFQSADTDGEPMC